MNKDNKNVSQEQPFIAPTEALPELTPKVILISILLAFILAMSNAYLALKIGILTSASIPAAVIAMGLLRCFKNANILENNLIQTAASAGEAVAGGIVYTVPALIIIGYWADFDYWQCVVIALVGGILGVLFSIPLRQVLVTEPTLRFPEGKAIAELLKLSASRVVGLKEMLWGGVIGAVLELAQTGFKVLANSWQVWFEAKRTVFGFGAGFSATMIGAGYIMGFHLCASIMIGALIGWLISVPVIAELSNSALMGPTPEAIAMNLWNSQIRYMGIGAMLVAGVWTLLTLIKPFIASIRASYKAIDKQRWHYQGTLRTERDLPLPFVVFGIIAMLLLWYWVQPSFISLDQLAISYPSMLLIDIGSVLYILVIGLVFSAITSYFSGLVGVTATPGSAIIMGSILLLSLILLGSLTFLLGRELTHEQILGAEALAIITGAVIAGAIAMANDNTQDLKVGHLLGATPWKQQIMLMIGVVVSSLIIPPIMQLLYEVYGIAGVMPRSGMDPTQSLPAPPAALMAAVSQSVFSYALPWDMVLIGALIAIAGIVLLKIFNKWPLSILGIAIGIYLPLASSTPLFIGGLIAWFTRRSLQAQAQAHSEETVNRKRQRGILLACGLVSGAALMDVVLALPFAMAHSPDVLKIVSDDWIEIGAALAAVCTALLAIGFHRTVTR